MPLAGALTVRLELRASAPPRSSAIILKSWFLRSPERKACLRFMCPGNIWESPGNDQVEAHNGRAQCETRGNAGRWAMASTPTRGVVVLCIDDDVILSLLQAAREEQPAAPPTMTPHSYWGGLIAC